jgi:hypothetical protein
MLAANIWHWWIGVALVLLAIVAVAALVGSYLFSVTSKQHPAKAQKSNRHTDL